MGIIGHMIATAIGVFFRVIFMAIIWGAVAAGITLLLSAMWLKGGRLPSRLISSGAPSSFSPPMREARPLCCAPSRAAC
jgi:hypothetical protein